MKLLTLLAAIMMLCICSGAAEPLRSASPVPADASVDDAAQTITHVYERNAAIKSYTFDASVYIALRRFPWLHFHLNGHGIYERDGEYRIQFYNVPFWAKGFDHFDLSSLDPHSWVKQYDVDSVAHQGASTTILMHDPKSPDLSGIRATLSPSGVSQIKWIYAYGGYVDMHVTQESASYILPAAEDADIVTPRMAAYAHADFHDYKVLTDGDTAAPADRRK